MALTFNGSQWVAMTEDAVTGGSATISQTEVDWGGNTTAETWKSFTVTDAASTTSKRIQAWLSYEAPTGKDLDELDMDGFELSTVAGTGSFTLNMRALDGPVHGKFKVNYIIGTGV